MVGDQETISPSHVKNAKVTSAANMVPTRHVTNSECFPSVCCCYLVTHNIFSHMFLHISCTLYPQPSSIRSHWC